MDEIQTLSERIQMLEEEIQSCYQLYQYHTSLANKAQEKSRVLCDDKYELINKKHLLQKATITEKERQEVLANMKFLETVLNSDLVCRIGFNLSESNSCGKLLSMRMDAEITEEGMAYQIFLHTNRTVTRDIVKSYLNVPESEWGYHWSKEEYPYTKFLKPIV